MASITNEPGGRRTIQFRGRDGKRHSVRLGKVSRRAAESFKLKLEQLVAASITGHPLDDETAGWVARLRDELAERLAAVGLIPARRAARLDHFLKAFLAGRSHLKPGSIKKLMQTAEKLSEFFGAAISIRDITTDRAAEWRIWLSDLNLSEATIKQHCGNAKTIFAEAVRRELIRESAFRHLRSGPTASRNTRYVTPEEAATIIAACPTDELRLLFALARYAGLRVPSETHLLTWGDLDPARGRMLVRSPKTEHHEGHAERLVPLDPRLTSVLHVLDTGEPDAPMISLKHGGQVHRRFRAIISSVGIEPWADLFQTLRRSCEKEWAIHFPQYAVSRWIGHSITVSGRHYVNSVPDELFELAASRRTARPSRGR